MSFLKTRILGMLAWALALLYGTFVMLYLTCQYVRGKITTSITRDVPPPCLHDPLLGRHKFFRLKQNMKLHYVESGNHENPLVILIHGSPDFWFTWRKQIPALSTDYWVVALDLRGCGDSEGPYFRTQYTTAELASDVAELIRLLVAKPAHLVCAGAGGQVGWHMAYHYPHLISKLVLIHSPHPYIIRHHFHQAWSHYLKAWYLIFLKLPLLPEVAAHANDSGVIDKYLKKLVKTKAVDEEDVEAYKFAFSRKEDWTGTFHILRSLDLKPLDSTEPLPDVITKPTLLIMGDEDTLMPLETAYRSAEYVERITIKPVQGPGYLCHVSDAQQVNTILGNFLRELPWKPLSPLEPSKSSSTLVGRVMGASLTAVSTTVNKTTGAFEMTKSIPGGLYGIAQATIKAAESKLGLE
ncbi:hypothetical protein SK128_020834 [Halocaridina rubra]|uniref:AB hydrolase-1 domain-containing protein n=1 Tax=Halocaridina rubra TaxID=373956 RepID=A0AAN8XT57_HALRR